jgi:hypothetical protein
VTRRRGIDGPLIAIFLLSLAVRPPWETDRPIFAELESEGELTLAGAQLVVTRDLARRGIACVALAALMLQIALSFAHFDVHGGALWTVGQSRVATASVAYARSELRASQNLPIGLAHDEEHCTICFSATLPSNAWLPDAPRHPVLSNCCNLDTWFYFLSRIFLEQRRLPFLSRAPPVG